MGKVIQTKKGVISTQAIDLVGTSSHIFKKMVVFNLDLSSNFDDDLYLPRFKGAGNCAPFILCHLSPPGDTLDPWGTYDVPEKHEGRIYDTAVILRSTVDKSGWHSRLAVKIRRCFIRGEERLGKLQLDMQRKSLWRLLIQGMEFVMAIPQ